MPFHSDPSWFALTIEPNHERVTERALLNRGLEAYLPRYRVRRRWSDRVKESEAPLFPGYLFCRFSYSDRMRVLQSPGVRSIVGTRNSAIPVDDEEISAVRALISSGRPIVRWPYLHAGQKIVIRGGPLESLRGVVVRAKDCCRVVVSVEALNCSVAIELDADLLSPEPELHQEEFLSRGN